MCVCVCVCLPWAVLLQFEDMDRLSVAGGAQELAIGAEGQRTNANIPDTDRDGKEQKNYD